MRTRTINRRTWPGDWGWGLSPFWPETLLVGCDDNDVRLTYGQVTVRDPDRPVVFREDPYPDVSDEYAEPEVVVVEPPLRRL